jgi:small subunit ribosomal protein S8
MDQVADFLTRIRNAQMARKNTVTVKSSSLKERIAKILHDQGYLKEVRFDHEKGYQGEIVITLKYDRVTKKPVIKRLVRVSKPGCRDWRGVDKLPRILGGLGIAIISTPQDLMTDKEARRKNLGGEVLCYVY